MSGEAAPGPFTRGFSTVVLSATDLAAAKAWYSAVLRAEPYYDTPAYVEWRLGPQEHELGLLDRRWAGAGWSGEHDRDPGGAVVHLWVDDADTALQELVDAGAAAFQPVRDFGEPGAGYRGGSVADPFGNVIGVITRPA